MAVTQFRRAKPIVGAGNGEMADGAPPYIPPWEVGEAANDALHAGAAELSVDGMRAVS